MEDTIDLFENYETLPKIVQTIIFSFDEDADAYKECKNMEKLLIPHGYTFDWGLSGEPFNLRMVSECNVGDWAMIGNDVVADEGVQSNYGMVMGFSVDDIPYSDEKKYYAHLTLKNGESATVNALDIKKLY